MSLVRAWRRAALGASGVGLLVPVALTGALAISATVGRSGVEGLEQVFAGPAIPRASQDTLDGAAREGRTDADVPAVPRARSSPSDAERRAARARARRAARGAGGGRSGPGSRPGGAGGGGVVVAPGGELDRGAVRRTPPQRRPGSSTGTRPDRPDHDDPPRPQNPVRRIGSALADTVRQLPTVGEPAGDAVQTVVDLIVPPGAARTAAPAPAPAPAAEPPPAEAPAAPAAPAATAPAP